MTWFLRLAALGSGVLLFMSVYPGVLADLFFIAELFSFLWVPALGIVLFIVRQARVADKKSVETNLDPIGDEIVGDKKRIPHRRWSIFSPAVVVLSLVLILSGIPRRVAFVLSRPAFQRLAATAPVSGYDAEAVGHLVGVYYVDLYGADPRGGVYFRTHAGPDGIGPDTMSYGFVYRPNPKGTPFGNSGYRYSHVVGDWYCFSASND